MGQPDRSGPLTFGQLYIWRNAEPYPFEQELLTHLPLPARLPDWASTTPPRSRWHQPTLRSTRAAAPLQSVAANLGATRQSVLLALAYIALWRVFGWARPVLSLMASNRWHSRDLQRLVCCNAQPIPLAMTIEPAQPFGVFVAMVQNAAHHAYQHGCYDLDEVHDIGGRAIRRRDAVFDRQFIFNYVGEFRDGSGASADAGPPAMNWLPERNAGPNGMLIRDEGDALWLWLRMDAGLLVPERAARLIGSIEEVLLALDSEGAVRDIASHPSWSAV